MESVIFAGLLISGYFANKNVMIIMIIIIKNKK